MSFQIDLIVGARPNFVKAAALLKAMHRVPELWTCRLIHTGQHYDEHLSQVFFKNFDLPKPIELGVGSDRPARQLARIMIQYDAFLSRHGHPDATLVLGDVNSTLACALVASKRNIPLVHVEAGLRSFDGIPEENNRKLTDQLADKLYATDEMAQDNLIREGIEKNRICVVGNVMIDTLVSELKHARELQMWKRLGLEPMNYAILTLHRPSNVDDRQHLEGLLESLDVIAQTYPIIFPIHPRTEQKLSGLRASFKGRRGWQWMKPLSYHQMLSLMDRATLIITDSGGIQEESSYLDIPCMTLRQRTERPLTTRLGSNRLVQPHPMEIERAWKEFLSGRWPKASTIPLWDGKASQRLFRDLSLYLKDLSPSH